ncbi:MAG TPA: hypothetical protein VGO93_17265 [Candidatus Xenobia bacterium]
METGCYSSGSEYRGWAAEALHREAVSIRLSHTEGQFRLAHCLLALDRGRGHVALGFSSVESYAAARLDVTRQKVRELLRVARVLERIPVMRQAFRTGQMNWAEFENSLGTSRPRMTLS